ncbi:MAG: FlgD immunoglobulin-like domain containing protein [Candidatus Zixiibacteriota bacterium]
MTSRHRTLFFLVTLAIATLWAGRSGAENAVRFTDTTAQAGERFSVGIVIANDVILGGAFIPFRWSSADLRFDSVIFVTDRFHGDVVASRTATDRTHRTSGILLSTSLDPGEQAWIPVGEGPVARLHFTVSQDATDQIAFVDSVQAPLGSGQFVQFTTYDGGTLLLPDVYAGAITIGHPAAVTMQVSPAAMSFRGEVGGLDPPGQRLSISSSSQDFFSWSAQWTNSWLSVLPPEGKAPAQPQVTVDLFVLPEGRYEDTIVLESRHAVNSPVRIPIVLTVDTAGFRPPVDLGFALFQNYPNPFVTYHDPETEIRYYLKEAKSVQIRIYNAVGQLVRVLLSGHVAAGERSLIWDGRDESGVVVPSGRYFCRMTTSTGAITRPMIVIK